MKKVYINTKALEDDEASIVKIVASDRSDGKTTALMRLAYDSFKKTGKIAVIARRTCGEVTHAIVDVMITNLKKVRQTGTFTHKGSPQKSGIHVYEDGVECFVFIPLSRAGKVKSGMDIATHINLYIDEYVPLDDRYLTDEVEKILEIHRTIDRDTYTSKIWIFFNHVTASCPIYRYFSVTPRDGVSRWKNGRLILLQIANSGNRRDVMCSPLGELVEGTPYGTYAAGGTLDKSDAFVLAQHQKHRLPCVIRAATGLYGLYFSKINPQLLIIDKAQKKTGDVLYTVGPTSGLNGGIWLRAREAKDFYDALRAKAHFSMILCATAALYDDVQDLWTMLTR